MKHSILGAVAGAGLLALTTTPSHAVLRISANINGQSFQCVDNTSCDTNNTTGILNVGTQNIGGVTIFGTFQTQEIAGAGTTFNRLDTTSFNIQNNNTTTVPITVAVGGTDFAGPVRSFTASGTTNFSNAVGSDFRLAYYADPNNIQGADTPNDTPGTVLEDTGVQNVTLQSQAFSVNQTGSFVDPNLFSLTLFANADLTAGGTLTNRTQSTILEQVTAPVSEPGSAAILATGTLLLMGGLALRRREQE